MRLLDVILEIGGDALQPANCDRSFLDTARGGTQARTDDRRCVPEFPETHSIAN